ncbi:MAG: ROK family protein [Simkaniaceae bacterium]|nr:ROK family protein [Simkaniaceae bacterium]
MARLGIDIGGTKISISVGEDSGAILTRERIPTLADEGPEQALKRLLTIAKKYIAEYDIESIGISSPGPISYTEGKMLALPNLPKWEGISLRDHIELELNKPCEMNNDGNACALAEYTFGPYRGCPNLIYLTASTGMGGGIIANGELLQGITDTAGEVGHMVLDINGPECPCGNRGCFEAYCGGGPLAKRLSKELNKPMTMEDLIEAAQKNDPYALNQWEQYCERLAQGIGTLLMICNPEVIILGTIAMHAKDFLLEPVRQALPKYTWSYPLEAVEIVASTLEHVGDLSALALSLEALPSPQS